MKLAPPVKLNLSSENRTALVYVILFAATFAAFWLVNQCGFVNIDDPVYVTENGHVQSGLTLQSVYWAFSTVSAGFWHPLTWLSLMLDHQLYGLNAGGYHLTNLILHILSTLLLFRLFHRMTGAIWRSAFIAASFALHPLHVESVAWIAERKDVLGAFFWMLTLNFYVYYTERPAIRRYLPVLFVFVLGLMCKSMIVTLPIVLLLLDYWPLGRFQSSYRPSAPKVFGVIPLRQLYEKLPFFILSAVFSMMTLHAQLSVKHIPLIFRIANAPVTFVTYLGKMFWPVDLAVFYPFSYALPAWQVLGASVLILLISAAVVLTVKRCPYLFVGWFWYVTTILLVIGIIQIGEFSMADRYTYLPSIGIAVMLAWGLPALFENSSGVGSRIWFPAGTAALAVLAVLTWQQCGYWKDSVALFNHALRVTKDNDVAHNNLGKALIESGRNEEAIDQYNKIIHMGRASAITYYNRANACYNLGRYESAVDDYKRAIRLNPRYVEAYNNRGSVYFRMGQDGLAIEDYGQVVRLNADYAPAYYNRGNVFSKLGREELAVRDFDQAIRLKPDYSEAVNNRGISYLKQGNNKLGCSDVQRACTMGQCHALLWARGKALCP